MAVMASAAERKVTYPVAAAASIRVRAMGPYACSRDLSSMTPHPGGSPATITNDGCGAAAGAGTGAGGASSSPDASSSGPRRRLAGAGGSGLVRPRLPLRRGRRFMIRGVCRLGGGGGLVLQSSGLCGFVCTAGRSCSVVFPSLLLKR